MHNPGTLVVHILAAISASIPLIFHIPHRNVGVINLCAWTVALEVIMAINVIIWDEVKNPVTLAPGYCDIASRVWWVGGSPIVLSGIVVLRQLFNIMRAKTSAVTQAARRRQLFLDLATIYLPTLYLLFMQAVFFPTARYSIFPVVGCAGLGLPSSPVTLVVSLVPPIVGTVAAGYALGVLYLLWRKRTEFREIVRSSGSGISNGRFIRLVVLCAVVSTLFYPISIYWFATGTAASYAPSKRVPYSFARSRMLAKIVQVYYGDSMDTWVQWIYPGFALTLGPLFGTGNEALALYARGLRFIGLGPAMDWISRKSYERRQKRASRLGSHGSSRKSLLSSLTGGRLSVFSSSTSGASEKTAGGAGMASMTSATGDNDKHIMVSRDTEIDLEALINSAPSPIRPRFTNYRGLSSSGSSADTFTPPFDKLTGGGSEMVEVIDKMPVTSITKVKSSSSNGSSNDTSR